MDTRSARQRLQDLAARPPDAESRAEVMHALDSSVDSLRDEAANVLGAWADPESVLALRALLARGLTAQPFAWVIRARAIRALLLCIDDRDAPWVLELYFSIPEESARRDLFPLLLRLSNASQQDRIVSECASDDPKRRHAALVACAALHLSDEPGIVERLAVDPDPGVASHASRLLERVRRRETRHESDSLLQVIVAMFRPEIPDGRRSAKDDSPPAQSFLQEYTAEHGELLQCWRFARHGLERVPPSSWRSIGPGRKKGMYNENAIIKFWLSENEEKLFVDWVVGPLFGRGLTFRVRGENGGVRLEDEQLRWSS